MNTAPGILELTLSSRAHHAHRYLGIGCSLLAAFGWGTEGVLATFGMDMVDPAVAINIREATSCLVSLLAVLPFVAGVAVFGQALITPNVVWIIALAGLYWSFRLPALVQGFRH